MHFLVSKLDPKNHANVLKGRPIAPRAKPHLRQKSLNRVGQSPVC